MNRYSKRFADRYEPTPNVTRYTWKSTGPGLQAIFEQSEYGEWVHYDTIAKLILRNRELERRVDNFWSFRKFLRRKVKSCNGKKTVYKPERLIEILDMCLR